VHKTLLNDEEVCLKMAKSFDTELLGELYDRYSGKVYGRCLTMTKDPVASADVTHDIFLKVFAKCRTFKGESSFSTWLYSIVYHTVIDVLRKRQKMVFEDSEMLENLEDSEQEEAQLRSIRVAHLHQVMTRLEHKEATILIMHYLDGISVKQISEMLNISESAVKMRLARSRQHALQISRQLEKI
jgi:RNA polymerase sigma-70 factor (ECF subfamily)